MKYGTVLLSLCAAAICTAQSDTQPSKNTAHRKQTKASQKTAAAQGMTIPKDAVANSDGTYSYTDKDGKKWLYANTPFGVTRGEDRRGAPAPTPAPSKDAGVTVTESGDTVKFVRQTPFGPMKWEKKKSDLTDEERRMYEAHQPNTAAAPGTAQGKPE